MTATPVDTEQYCSPCPLNPDMPTDVCFNLENEERIELEELKSSSAGTGLETPGQQCPPRTNQHLRHLDRGLGFIPRRKNFNYDGTSEGHDNDRRYFFECCDPIKTQAHDF